ncbi:MAG: DNA helicase [Leifsonia sp.]
MNKLRASAEELWSHQQDVLDRANSVAREAGRQVGYLSREEVAPRVRSGYNQYLQPRVDATRQFASETGHALEQTVLPAVGTVLGSVLTIGDIAKDKRVRAAIDRLNRGKVVVPVKSGPGIGTYLAVAAGVVAVAGVAYAVWQTFRADDELWIADEPVGPSEVPTSD